MENRFEARTGYANVSQWLEWPNLKKFESYFCVFVLSKEAPEEIRKAAIRESIAYLERALNDCQMNFDDIFVMNENGEISGIVETGGFADDARGLWMWMERGELSKNMREWW